MITARPFLWLLFHSHSEIARLERNAPSLTYSTPNDPSTPNAREPASPLSSVSLSSSTSPPRTAKMPETSGWKPMRWFPSSECTPPETS